MTSERKALCMLTGAFHLGGGIAAANRLAIHALLDHGYHVDIIALNEQTHPSQQGTTQRGFSNNKRRFALAVWRAVLSRHFDFIFCDHANLAAILLPLRVFTNKSIVVRLNGVEVFPPYPSFEGRLGLRSATHLTAISEFTRIQVMSQFPQLDVTTIDLSLSQSASDLIPELSDHHTDEIKLKSVDGNEHTLQSRCILLVGRMASNERYKGHDVLIQAMASIVSRHPTAQLVLVGRGDDYERLRQIALSQPDEVRNSIFMPGFIDDDLLQRLYQYCYLFAMPSRGEGFGLVYLEAMRWSRACLGSSVDAASTIIVDGETGVLLTDPTNIQHVASSIIDLMDCPAMVEQMGRNGLERLNQQYLFECFSQRFVGWIDQLASQSRHSFRS